MTESRKLSNSVISSLMDGASVLVGVVAATDDVTAMDDDTLLEVSEDSDH